MQGDKTVDAKGLNCPLPILRTKKMLAQMEMGETVLVLTTDPGSKADFVAFAKQTCHELIEQQELDGEYHYLLRKG